MNESLGNHILEKKQVCNYELEEVILGAMLLEKHALSEVVEMINVQSFYKEEHQHIFKAIVELFKDSKTIDIITVTNHLQSKGKLKSAGGAHYISQLTLHVNSAANIVHHAAILLQYAIKRELIKAADDILKRAYQDTTDAFALLDIFEQKLFQISESNIRKNYIDFQTACEDTVEELIEKRNSEENLTGIPSGFSDLDRITTGWQKSDLVIIAARPSMGKTSFVLSILLNASIDFKHPVAIFSLEMSTSQIVKRIFSNRTDIENSKLRTPKSILSHQWEKFVDKITELKNLPFFIDDSPAISILDLRAKARRLKAQHDIQIIVVDYLQLMSGDYNNLRGNREQEVAQISRALKQLAKELDVPMLVVSQLSRAVEIRGGNKRPQLSDLRESGAIEQDADVVIFLYRPEYYGMNEDEEGNSAKELGEVIIAKQRNGPLGTVKLKFISEYTRFADWDENIYTNDYVSFTNQNRHNDPPSGSDRKENIRSQSKIDKQSDKGNHSDLDDEVAPF